MKKQRIRHYSQPSDVAIPQGGGYSFAKKVENIYGANLTSSPAAVDTICRHLREFERAPSDYDRIVTGDLGQVGKTALLDLLKEKGIDISGQHMDCGIEIYDETQDAHAGGSGCGCAAVTLAGYLLKKLKDGTFRRILFVPTGALLSKVSFNEGKTIPGVAHAIELVGRK